MWRKFPSHTNPSSCNFLRYWTLRWRFVPKSCILVLPLMLLCRLLNLVESHTCNRNCYRHTTRGLNELTWRRSAPLLACWLHPRAAVRPKIGKLTNQECSIIHTYIHSSVLCLELKEASDSTWHTSAIRNIQPPHLERHYSDVDERWCQ